MLKFLVLFLLPFSVSALTESEFIQSLLDNHTFFEKEQINLTIKQIEMEGDRANYADWEWVMGGELGYISKSKNKENYTSSYDYSKSTSQKVRKFSSDLTKKFSLTVQSSVFLTINLYLLKMKSCMIKMAIRKTKISLNI